MYSRSAITVAPGERGGQPCIRGLRITLSDMPPCLAAGVSHQEILDDFPCLTDEAIPACLASAAERERRTLVVRKS